MSKNFVITRPMHDMVTSYLYDFSKQIVETVKSAKDIHVTRLDGHSATRANFEKVLTKENPRLAFLNGHGDRKNVAGHDDEIILDEQNIGLTKDKIVYALSCDSLEELGQLAIRKGAKAYVGYKARFMFIRDPTRENTPSKDNNALPFKRACSALINSLVFGRTVIESIDEAKKEYLHSIRSYGTEKDDPYGDAPLIRFALAWDLEFLDMYGDPHAKF